MASGSTKCPQKQSRNKIQQTRKTPEKNQWHNDNRSGQNTGRGASQQGDQDPAMPRSSYRWMGALFGISLAMVGAGHSNAEAAITRSERCNRLSQQLDEAIENHAQAVQVAQAKALQKKATRYCADHKQAQGIRTFANALKLLGVTPDDSSQ
ncbi:hypothetical protein ACHMW4_07665 [Mesorhizobium sp. UC22_110]|uniref:hypothetical protein n=1 Tax=unclassified Mesorhizobium TaxID=325217 RepID=UPI0036701FA4